MSRAEAVEATAEEILDNARRACPQAEIEGVLVQEMVTGGAEFILGMSYDELFGPLIVVGGGGVMVEIFKDAAVGLAPLSPAEADEMIGRLKISRLLDGFGGAGALDRDALVSCLVTFFRIRGGDGRSVFRDRPQSGLRAWPRFGRADRRRADRTTDIKGGKK